MRRLDELIRDGWTLAQALGLKHCRNYFIKRGRGGRPIAICTTSMACLAATGRIPTEDDIDHMEQILDEATGHRRWTSINMLVGLNDYTKYTPDQIASRVEGIERRRWLEERNQSYGSYNYRPDPRGRP